MPCHLCMQDCAAEVSPGAKHTPPMPLAHPRQARTSLPAATLATHRQSVPPGPARRVPPPAPATGLRRRGFPRCFPWGPLGVARGLPCGGFPRGFSAAPRGRAPRVPPAGAPRAPPGVRPMGVPRGCPPRAPGPPRAPPAGAPRDAPRGAPRCAPRAALPRHRPHPPAGALSSPRLLWKCRPTPCPAPAPGENHSENQTLENHLNN
jgi:hypothetical protein